ncbi:MAG: protein BatD [Xanthomonadales bacterium]|nr:protein BatD [Xanthomonadales bacterium]
MSRRDCRVWRSLLFAFLLLLAFPTLAARAWLDRSEIELGETVTLNVEADAAGGEPDFSVLAANFEIVGQSSQSQVNFVNGQRSARTLWAVALSPKAEGVIGIPALDVGAERTDALTLTVKPPSATADAHAGDDVFLEVETTPGDPYVQQQVRFVVRLYYAVTLLEGQLDEPKAPDVEFRRTGNDRNFQKVIANRRYNVVERRYLLLPERSGEVTIPGVRFRGRAADPSRRGFGFGGGRTVSAHSPSQTLTVRPQPDATGAPWLPAEQLRLLDNRRELPAQVEVGEPITLDQRLGVLGLAASQLPELTLPEIDGASVYPDQPSSREEDVEGMVRATTARKFAIVPSRPGSIDIPAQTLEWWNTVTDQAEEVHLPPKRITVVPAAGAVSDAALPASAEPATSSDVPEVAPVQVATEPGIWRTAAIVLGLLWLISMVLLVLRWRRAPVPATLSSPAHSEPDMMPLKQALKPGDLQAIDRTLRSLARQQGVNLSGPGGLAVAFDDADQRAAVARMDAARFGSDDAGEALAALRSAFGKGPRFHHADAGKSKDDALLPPLYPR